MPILVSDHALRRRFERVEGRLKILESQAIPVGATPGQPDWHS